MWIFKLYDKENFHFNLRNDIRNEFLSIIVLIVVFVDYSYHFRYHLSDNFKTTQIAIINITNV